MGHGRSRHEKYLEHLIVDMLVYYTGLLKCLVR